MKKNLLLGAAFMFSLALRAQHLLTTIKVVGGKARIAVKATGGDITGQVGTTWIFTVAIPKANQAAVLATPTVLIPAKVPSALQPIASYTDPDGPGAMKYFNLFYSGAQPTPTTFTNNVEYDILELNWTGTPQSCPVSLICMADGNPSAPVLASQWLNYMEIDGAPVVTGDDLFYQSGSSGPATQMDAADFSAGLASVTTSSVVTLPVSFINFSGFKSGAKNVLNWTTGSEANSQAFEVQRSADGGTYTAIGSVNSKAVGGNSSSELNYTYEDNSPLSAKKSFYRLRQLDIDSRSTLSNVVIINGEKPKTMEIGGLFPNPANDKLNVIVSAPQRGNVTLAVLDMNGKTISQKLINVEAGSNTVPVEISQLTKGNYLVKVIDRGAGTESAASKFVKQ